MIGNPLVHVINFHIKPGVSSVKQTTHGRWLQLLVRERLMRMRVSLGVSVQSISYLACPREQTSLTLKNVCYGTIQYASQTLRSREYKVEYALNFAQETTIPCRQHITRPVLRVYLVEVLSEICCLNIIRSDFKRVPFWGFLWSMVI